MSAETKKKAERKGPEKKEESVERGVLGITAPSIDELRDYVKSVKVLTPSSLAERFKVRVSVAKSLLRELVAKGIVKEVVGINRIRVYAPLLTSAPTESKPAEAEAKPKKVKKPSKQASSAPQS
ncbi:MAG: eS25 family ribosomal protein [Candidatus Caldarchaeum sp.]|nr:eS25 family ribosomal protein [Candidatus Caldarchaeum sp.]